MLTLEAHKVRRSRRTVARTGASVIVDLASRPKRIPCLIVDRSAHGFRLRLHRRLRQGQAVEVIPNDDPLLTILCTVVWVGKSGSKQEGEAGLHAHPLH